MIPVFRLLGARRLRLQPLKAGIAVVAVAAGVALATAVLITVTSIDRSVRDFGRDLAGPAPLRIVGATTRGGLPPAAVDAAAQVVGVADVVPVVQAVSVADARRPTGSTSFTHEPVDVLVLGVDCRAAALFVADRCDDAAFEAAGDGVVAIGPALAEALADGTGASLRTEAGRIPLDDVPVLDELAEVAGGFVAVQSIEGAQHRFLQEGELDVAFVLPEPGADVDRLATDIESAIGGPYAVLAADEPPPQIGAVLLSFLPLFTLLALFGLGIGAVLVRNTLVLSLEERRRQLAVLGALGAPRRMVMGGILAEAALLGLVGGAVGTLAGAALAGPIVGSLSEVTRAVAGVPVVRHVPPAVVGIGLLLGASVAAATAVLPARRALRIDVAGELSGRGRVEEGRLPRLVRRSAVAVGLVSVAVAACWASGIDGGIEPWQVQAGMAGTLGVAIGCLIATGTFAPLLLGALARRARRSRRPALVLGLAALVRDPRRTGALVTAVCAPVVVAFAADGAAQSARASIEREFTDLGEGVSVSTTSPGEGSSAFLGAEARELLADLPGVDDVETWSFLVAGNDFGQLIGVEAADGELVLGTRVIDGTADRTRFAAGQVLVGPGLARRDGIRAGDVLRVPTPAGFAYLPVQGVWEDGAFGGHTVTVPHHVMVRHWGPQPAGFVLLRPAPGTSEEELADAVRAVQFEIDPQLQVRTSPEVADAVGDAVEAQMVPFTVLQRGLLLVAFVAVLSTLLLAGYQRRREHGLLAAAGAVPLDLGRAVVAEAGLVGAASIVLAAAVGPVVLWSLLQVLPLLIGFRDPFRPDWAALPAAGAVSVTVALLAALWPAWRASRVEVLDALRYE